MLEITRALRPVSDKSSQQAFQDAIDAGRLSADPKADNYAGHYMYMGPGRGGDAFKHRLTRQYIN